MRSHHEPTAGYRESAVPAAIDEGLIAFFSLEPTLPFARVLIGARAPWPPEIVARVGVELAQALSEGTSERFDPFSTGLSASGAWLLDLGLDALLRPEIRAQAGLRGSTSWLGYLAPESLRRRGAGDVTGNDLGARHGLGVLLHELLTGVPLYGGQTPLETLVALRRGLPELLSKTVPGIPIDIAACVHALLDHDPLRRPDPALVIDVLAPYAAPDLAWAQPLLAAQARPLGHLPFGARRSG
ncbi:MAG: hypothetical protein J0L92_09210 [Deltaproteobacteria bacterium]|nr:hypothetical protein [Deltaproteobacteria bacterium]